jgi:hypothetical protein
VQIAPIRAAMTAPAPSAFTDRYTAAMYIEVGRITDPMVSFGPVI